MVAYYQRAVNILRRTNSRDRPRVDLAAPTFTGAKEFILSCVINAFVKGLYNPYLRRKVMNHSGASCGSLWKSYEIVLQTQKSI